MQKGLNASQLKLIAIFGMTLDHIAVAFAQFIPFGWRLVMYFFGGLTFPIMSYLMTEGYKKTGNVKRYLLRLLLFAAITQYPYIKALGISQLNVLFTLAVCLCLLILRDKLPKDKPHLYIIIVIAVALLTSFCFDWGGTGILLFVFYNEIPHPKKRIWIPIVFLVGLNVLQFAVLAFLELADGIPFSSINNFLGISFFMGSLMVIPLLFNYNGERGKPMKHFFYAYYPVHLAIFAIIKYLFRA